MSEPTPLDASAVPEYLETTHKLVQELNKGSSPVEAVVSAIAQLEQLIRIPPANGTIADGFVNTGALEARLPDMPITQQIVRKMESSDPNSAADQGIYALAALNRAALIVNLSAAFEELFTGLAARIRNLEQGQG